MRIKAIGTEQRGYTLVELMVSFALLALLLTTAIATLSPAINIFNRALNVTRAQTVTNIILDKITAELSACKGMTEVTATTVSYSDQNGVPVMLYLKEGKMYMDYNGGDSAVKEGEGGETDGVTWFFANSVYMGNRITNLTFQVSDPDKSLIEVTLEIKNEQTGFSYKREKTIQCYELKTGIFL